MEKLDYNLLKQLSADVDKTAQEAKDLREYNIKQNYLRAVSKLCKSDILEDWIELNKATDFKTVKTLEYYDKSKSHWVQFINKYIKRDGKLSTSYDDLYIAFNPQTTWMCANGGFGAYRSWGSCGDTNALYFRPDDVDTVNNTIVWHEFKGTKSNEISRDGSWFGDAYELKTALLNELISNYERYRNKAYNVTLEAINSLQAKANNAKQAAADLLVEDY